MLPKQSGIYRAPRAETGGKRRLRVTSASGHLSRLQGRIKLTGFNYPQLFAAGVPTQTPSVEAQDGILQAAFKRQLGAPLEKFKVSQREAGEVTGDYSRSTGAWRVKSGSTNPHQV